MTLGVEFIVEASSCTPLASIASVESVGDFRALKEVHKGSKDQKTS